MATEDPTEGGVPLPRGEKTGWLHASLGTKVGYNDPQKPHSERAQR